MQDGLFHIDPVTIGQIPLHDRVGPTLDTTRAPEFAPPFEYKTFGPPLSTAPGPLQTNPDLYEDVRIANQSGWTNWWNTFRNSWNETQIGVGASDLMDGLTKKANLQNELNQLEADKTTGRVNEFEYLQKKNEIYDGLQSAYNDIREARISMYEDEQDKNPISKAYRAKTEISNLQGADATFLDKIKYQLPTVAGSSGALMIPGLLAAFGQKQIAAAVARGVAGSALGTTVPGAGNVIGFVVGAGLTVAANMFTRNLESKAEVGGQFLQNYDYLKAKYLEDKPFGYQLTEDEDNKLVLQAAEGADEQYAKNMSLALSDTVQSMLLAGSFSKMFGKLGNINKFTRLGTQLGQYYLTRKLEGVEEGLQYAWSTDKTLASLGIKNQRNFVSSLVNDYKNVLGSMTWLGFQGDGLYSKDKEFKASVAAGELLGGLFAGTRLAFDIGRDLHGYRSTTKEFQNLHPEKVNDPVFRFKNEVYESFFAPKNVGPFGAVTQTADDRVFYLKESLKHLSKARTEKGEPLLEKDELRTELENIDKAYNTFSRVNNAVESVLPPYGKENLAVSRAAKAEFRKTLFNNTMQLERLGNTTKVAEGNMLAAMGTLSDISQIHAKLDVVRGRIENSGGEVKKFLEKEERQLQKDLASAEKTYTALDEKVPAPQTADQQTTHAIERYYDSASLKYDYEQEKKSLSKVKDWGTLKGWMKRHEKVMPTRELEKIEEAQIQDNKKFAEGIGLRPAFAGLSDEEKKVRRTQNEDILRRVNFTDDYIKTLTDDDIDKQAELALKDLKEGVFNVTEDFILESILGVDTKDNLEAFLSRPAIRAAFTNYGFKFEDDLDTLKAKAETRYLELKEERKNKKVRTERPKGMQSVSMTLVSGRPKHELDTRDTIDYEREFNIVDGKAKQSDVLQAIIRSKWATEAERAQARQMLAITTNEVINFRENWRPKDPKVPVTLGEDGKPVTGDYTQVVRKPGATLTNLTTGVSNIVIDLGFYGDEIQGNQTKVENNKYSSIAPSFETTVLHELWHAYTTKAINTNPELAKKLEAILEKAREKAAADGIRYYGTANVRELVSEAWTSPEFQSLLASIDSTLSTDERSNGWTDLLRIISELLEKVGLRISPTALEDVMSLTAQYAGGGKGLTTISEELNNDMDKDYAKIDPASSHASMEALVLYNKYLDRIIKTVTEHKFPKNIEDQMVANLDARNKKKLAEIEAAKEAGRKIEFKGKNFTRWDYAYVSGHKEPMQITGLNKDKTALQVYYQDPATKQQKVVDVVNPEDLLFIGTKDEVQKHIEGLKEEDDDGKVKDGGDLYKSVTQEFERKDGLAQETKDPIRLHFHDFVQFMFKVLPAKSGFRMLLVQDDDAVAGFEIPRSTETIEAIKAKGPGQIVVVTDVNGNPIKLNKNFVADPAGDYVVFNIETPKRIMEKSVKEIADRYSITIDEAKKVRASAAQAVSKARESAKNGKPVFLDFKAINPGVRSTEAVQETVKKGITPGDAARVMRLVNFYRGMDKANKALAQKVKDFLFYYIMGKNEDWKVSGGKIMFQGKEIGNVTEAMIQENFEYKRDFQLAKNNAIYELLDENNGAVTITQTFPTYNDYWITVSNLGAPTNLYRYNGYIIYEIAEVKPDKPPTPPATESAPSTPVTTPPPTQPDNITEIKNPFNDKLFDELSIEEAPKQYSNELGLFDNQTTFELVKTIDLHVHLYIREQKMTIIQADQDIDFINKVLVFTRTNILHRLELMKADRKAQLDSGKISQVYYEAKIRETEDKIDKVTNRWDEIKKYYLNSSYVFSFGADVSYRYDEDGNLDVSGDDTRVARESGFDKVGNATSPIDGASKEIKALIRGLPKYKKVDGKWGKVKNSFNLPDLNNFAVTWNNMLRNLQPSNSFEESMEILNGLRDRFPEYNELIQALQIYYEKALAGEVDAIIMLSKFQQDFGNPEIPVIQNVMNINIGSGNTIFKTDEATRRNIKDLRKQALDNFRYKSRYAVRTKQGDRALHPKIVDLPTGTKEERVTFLEALGFQFSPETLRDPDFAAVTSKSIVDTFKNTLKTIFQFVPVVKDPLGEISRQTTYNPGWSKRISDILAVESRYTITAPTQSVISADGTMKYAISRPNGYSTIIKAINSAKTFQELTSKPEFSFLNRPYARTSNLLNQIFVLDSKDNYGTRRQVDGKPVTLRLLDVSGLDIEGGEGNVTVSMFIGDKLVSDFNQFLKSGSKEFTRAGDKNSAFGMKLSTWFQPEGRGHLPVSDFNLFKDGYWNPQVEKIFTKYLTGEVARMILGAQGNFEDLRKGDGMKSVSLFFSFLPASLRRQLKADVEKLPLLEPNSDDLYATAERIAADYITKPETVKEIKAFFAEELKKKVASFNRYGFYFNDPYWLDDSLKKYPKETLLRTYLVNEFIFHVEQTKLFNGDIVFYSNKDGEATKRFPSMGATGLRPVGDKWFLDAMNNHPFTNLQAKNLGITNPYSNVVKTVVFRESTVKSEALINSWGKALSDLGLSQSRINEILAEYKKGSKEADAQGWITMDYYRSFKISIGKWTLNQEAVYEKISRGEPLTTTEVENLGRVFPPVKAQYAGPIHDPAYHVPAFHKFSLFPLLPSAIKGTELEALNERMIRNNVGYALMESGSKVGTVGANLETFRDDNGKMKDPTSAFTHENLIFTPFLKEQVQIEPEIHNEVIFGTQFRTLLFSNIFSSGKVLNKDLSDLYDQYKGVIDELTNYEKERLIESMGIEAVVENGQVVDYKVIDQAKLIDKIRAEVKRRKLNNAVKDFFEMEDGKLKYSLDASINHQQIRNLVMSMINNKLIRQTMKGDLAVQVSGLGFEKLNKPTERDEIEYGTSGLRFYTVKNGKVRAMQVKTSLTGDFKYLLNARWNGEVIGTLARLNQALKDEGWMDQNRHLVTMVGYRIPTQGLNSMEVMEVAEFLPPESGGILIVPAEIVTKSGSDFDIDKLSIFKPSISRRGEYIERSKFRSINVRSVDSIQSQIDTLVAQKKSYQFFERLSKTQQDQFIKDFADQIYDITKVKTDIPADISKALGEIGITIQSLRDKISGVQAKIDDLTNELESGFNSEDYEQLVGWRAEQEDYKLELASEIEKKQQIQRGLIIQAVGSENIDRMEQHLNVLYDQMLFEENKFNGEINAKIKVLVDERDRQLREIRTYKAGLFNTVIEIATKRLTSLESFPELITPNSPDLVKGKVQRVAAKKGTAKKPYLHTNNLSSSTQEEKFLAGIPNKKALGIAAVANKMSQIFNKIGLNINSVFNRRPVWHPMISGSDFSSSMLPNNVSKSEIESQMINAYVDVLNDDFISQANLSRDTAGAFFYLLHLNHDYEQLIDFFNHPVIQRFVVELQKSKSAIRKHVALQRGELLNEEMIDRGEGFIDDLDKYVSKEALKQAIANTIGQPVFDSYAFRDEGLKIAKKNPDRFFSKSHLEGVANSSIDNISIAERMAILSYFMTVREESSELLKLQLANNYDTATSVNPIAHELREAIRDELEAKNLFSNTRVTKGTVIESFNQISLIGRILDAIMPVTLNREVRQSIVDMVKMLKGIDEDKLTRTFINDWLQFIAFNYGEIGGRRFGHYGRDLLFGETKLVNKLLDFKLDKKWDNLRSDFPVIENLRVDIEGNIGNVSLYREDNSPEYQNTIIEQFQKLANFDEEGYSAAEKAEIRQFFRDLMVLGFAQSGLNKSQISFSDLIPNDYYAPMMSQALNRYQNLSAEAKGQAFIRFVGMFKNINTHLVGGKRPATRYWRFKDYNTNNLPGVSTEATQTNELSIDDSFLSMLREKAGEYEKIETIQYFIDKAGEAPVQYYQKYGKEITDRLLAEIPTEQLMKNLDDLLNINPENPNVTILDKLISEREPESEQTNESTLSTPLSDGTYEALLRNLLEDGRITRKCE